MPKQSRSNSHVADDAAEFLVASPRGTPSLPSARSGGQGAECYELEAIPSVSPAFEAMSAVRRAVALLSRTVEQSSDRIEGELWYISEHNGPGKVFAATPQWIRCDTRRLEVWSSWCDQSRIIDTVSFDRMRLILNFSHAHKHKVCQRQAPITRYKRLNSESFSSMQPEEALNQTLRRGTATITLKKRRKSSTKGDFRTYHEGSMPRYYYFGVEFTRHNRTEDGKNRRRRRVMVFATDVQKDFITWLQFLSDKGGGKHRETVQRSGVNQNTVKTGTRRQFHRHASYFLNETDTSNRESSSELSLAFVPPEEIDDTTIQGDVPLEKPKKFQECEQSVFSLFTSSSPESTKTTSPHPTPKKSSSEVTDEEPPLDSTVRTLTPPKHTEKPTTQKRKVHVKKKTKKKTYEILRDERLTKENNDLRSKVEKLEIENSISREKLIDLQTSLEESKKRSKLLEEECEHLQEDLLKAERSRAELAKLLAESSEKEQQHTQNITHQQSTIKEQAVTIHALNEQIAAAHDCLRGVEGECGSLADLLGLPTGDDGSDLGADGEGPLLMKGVQRIAERLRLACCAVEKLEQQLKASEERERACAEECEKLRDRLQELELRHGDLEERLRVTETLERALRRQLRESLEEVRDAESAVCAAERALRCAPNEMDQHVRDTDGHSLSGADSCEPPLLSLPVRIERVAHQACEHCDGLSERLRELLDVVARGVCDEDALACVRELRCEKEAVETELQDKLREAEEQLCVVTACEHVFGEALCGDVVEGRQAELLCAVRADVGEACGVSCHRVIHAAIADGGSSVVFSVAHPYRVPPAAVLAKVDSCAFDRVRRVSRGCCDDTEVALWAGDDEAEHAFVVVGSEAGEALLSQIGALRVRRASVSDRLRAAEDVLVQRPHAVVCELERRVASSSVTIGEQAVTIHALNEQIAAAHDCLRGVEGECGSLADLLGLPTGDDGSDLGADGEGPLLMKGVQRIAERLRLACCAVEKLEQQLKASEERERACAEECEKLRDRLQELELRHGDLEERLRVTETLERALRRQLRESLEEVRDAESAVCAAERALRCAPNEMDQHVRDTDGHSLSGADSCEPPLLSLPVRIERVAHQACEHCDGLSERLRELLDVVARGVCDEDALACVRELRCEKEAVETELQDKLREAEEQLCVVTACEHVFGEALCGDVVEGRQAELLCAVRADVGEACGVSCHRVIHAAIADGGSSVVFSVAHPYRVPPAAVLAKVDSCAFDRVRRVSRGCCDDTEVALWAGDDEAEHAFVVVGSEAGEALLSQIGALRVRRASVSDRLRAAEDVLVQRPHAVVCELERRVASSSVTIGEQAVTIHALNEQIAAAHDCLRGVEGECGSLADLLGLPTGDDGSDLGADGEGPLLMKGVQRIAERLRLACCAVEKLEQQLKASEERERACAEECEKLRDRLQELELRHGDLEERLRVTETLERALRRQLRESLEEVRDAESAVCAAERALRCAPNEMDQHVRDTDGHSLSGADSCEPPLLSLPVRIERVAHQACEHCDGLSERLRELLDVVARGVCDEDALACVRELRCEKEAVETELQDKLREAEEQLCVVTACEHVFGEALCGDVVEGRQAELLCAVRADVGEACGVSCHRVIHAAIADGGSSVVFSVAHPYRVPPAAVLAKVDSCAFDRVRRVSRGCCDDTEVALWAGDDEAEHAFVVVGSEAGEALLSQIGALRVRRASVSDRLRAAEDVLVQRPHAVVCELERRVASSSVTIGEQAVTIHALNEQIAAAHDCLRGVEGECGSLADLLGLPTGDDGSDLGADGEGPLLMKGVQRIAERLRLACCAVEKLEQQLKASEERERACAEECEKLRDRLQELELRHGDLEERLRVTETLERALRRQLRESLEEVRDAESAVCAAERALRCAPNEMDQHVRDTDGHSLSGADSCEPPLLSLPVRIERVAHQACEHCDGLSERLRELLDVVARGVCDEDALACVRELRCEKEAVETELQDKLREAEEQLCVVTACEHVFGEALCGDVVEGRQAELLCAVRADVGEACGVSCHRVIHAAIADGGSSVVFSVAHPYRVPPAAVLAKVDSCAFDRVRRVSRGCCDDTEVALWAGDDEAEHAFVVVGSEAGEALLSQIGALRVRRASVSDRLRAAEDVLVQRPHAVVCELERRVASSSVTIGEQAVTIHALNEQIAAAHDCLRGVEGECGSLADLLGLPTGDDGSDLGADGEGPLLMKGVQRIAERLRLACCAVEKLEQQLKASEERERACAEECEKLRDRLQELELRHGDLEERLRVTETLERALRRQLRESLEEVRDAESAVCAAERALRCAPNEMDQHVRDTDGHSLSGADSCEPPLLSLPVRIERVAHQACEHCDGLSERLRELLDVVARGVCDEDALACVRELRCEKEAVETELQDKLREAEEQLCVVTACEHVFGEALCGDVVEGRQAELLCAVRADVGEACGVSCHRVIHAAIADGGSSVVFSVAHPYRVPPAAVLAKVDSCAFDRVRRVSRGCCDDTEVALWAGDDEAEHAFVVVGSEAGEALLSQIGALRVRRASVSDRLRAAEDVLVQRPHAVVCELERRVASSSVTIGEQAVTIHALNEQIAAAHDCLRGVEGECGSLADLLGLPTGDDGSDLGADGEGPLLMKGVQRIAERLRLACCAVEKLEQQLKASEERERACAEECEKLRDRLQELELRHGDLEERLRVTETLERALRRQLRESLEEVRDAESAVCAAERALRCAPNEMDQHVRDTDGHSLSGADSCEPPLLSLPVRIERVAHQACEHCDGLSERLRELLDVVARGVCDEDALACVRELRCEKEAVETELQDKLREAEEQLCVVTACEHVFGEALCGDVVEGRQAELLCAVRADVGEACGVSCHRVIHAAIADGGSSVVFSVAHPYRVPPAAVLAKVDSCAFDRVRRVSRGCCDDTEVALWAGDDEAEHAFVVVGSEAGEALLSQIGALRVRRASVSDRLRAAEDVLVQRPHAVVCELERRVASSSVTIGEQAVTIHALNEQIAAAHDCLRGVEGECGSLADLLGLPTGDDGSDLGADGEGPLLMKGVQRIAERLRLACCAVEKLEQQLKASEERERACAEECEKLRDRLQELELRHGDLEERLRVTETLERALRRQLRESLEEVRDAESAVCAAERALRCAPNEMDQHVRDTDGHSLSGADSCEPPLLSLPVRIERVAHQACEHCDGLSERLRELLDVVARGVCDEDALACVRELRCEKEAVETELQDKLREAEEQLCVVTACEHVFGEALCGDVVEGRQAELLCAVRADVGEACGVSCHRVIHAAIADGGSSVVFSVAHPYRVPPAAVLAKVDSCAFDRVRRVSRGCCDDTEVALWAGDDEAEHAFVVVGSEAGEALLSQIGALRVRRASVSDRLRAAEDVLVQRPHAVVCELERRVASSSVTIGEQAVTIHALNEQIAAAHDCLRGVEGECGSLADLLGLPTGDDGSDLGADGEGPLLMKGVQRIAERLRLACCAVEKLEQQLKASEERERACAEECEKLRDRLQELELRHGDLEERLDNVGLDELALRKATKLMMSCFCDSLRSLCEIVVCFC